jgi:hypothetical protein
MQHEIEKILIANPGISPRLAAIEVLHREILSCIYSSEKLPHKPTFSGGACLHLCMGAPCFEEDLHFTHGFDTDPVRLTELCEEVRQSLREKFALDTTYTVPVPESLLDPTVKQDIEHGLADFWRIVLSWTRPGPEAGESFFCVHVCIRPSATIEKKVLTGGKFSVNAESAEEIFAKKIIALGIGRNTGLESNTDYRVHRHRALDRISGREALDLWEINWLAEQGVKFSWALLTTQLHDNMISADAFWEHYRRRLAGLASGREEFLSAIRKFIPENENRKIADSPGWWENLFSLLLGLPETA